MIKNRSAAACLFAMVYGLFAYRAAADWPFPSLPVCRPQHEWRTPVPLWFPGLAERAKLDSAPPEPSDGVIYIDVGLLSYDPACVEPPPSGLFEFDVPKGTPGAPGGLKVKIADDQMREDSSRDCIFNGFYTATRGAARPDDRREVVLRPRDKFEIIGSGRYCRAGPYAGARRADHAPAAGHATPRAVLPTCRKTGEDRVEIPVWEPRFTSAGDLRSLPPEGDGKLVFMAIVAPIGECQGGGVVLELAHPGPDRSDEGTAVVLLGRSWAENGHCVLSSLYMNDEVGSQHGSVSITFKPVDEAKVASSGQFCLAWRHGPLHRPAAQK